MKTFQDQYLVEFPRVEKPRTSNGNHSAKLLEGDLEQISKTEYRVVSEEYSYSRIDYGHPGMITNHFRRGDVLQTLEHTQ